MQKQHSISISVAAAILIVLTIVGSVWDFDIANTVYLGSSPSENIFGVIFSYIGIIPTFVGWSFIGASIFYLAQKHTKNRIIRLCLMAFALLLFLLSFVYYSNTLYYSNANILKMHAAVAYSVSAAVICAAAFFGFRLAKRSTDPELLDTLLFLAVVSLVTLVIISAAKELMCRPRFRWVLAMDDAGYFRNWWQNGRAIRASLGADIVTDEFASLPSGHSAYSMFAIFLFPVFAGFSRSPGKYKTCLFAFGFVWWALTAFSRMTVGAHYLTDVTIAGLVTILVYTILSAVKRVCLKRKGIPAAGRSK